MHIRIWDTVCVAVLLTILTLGLWPFHAPKNNVSWLQDGNGLRFGKVGTVFGSNAFDVAKSHDIGGASIEIWVKPAKVWDSGTLLTLYRPENLFQFSLSQSLSDFEFAMQNPVKPLSGTARFYADNAFLKGSLLFITVSSSGQGISVYVDGVLVQTAQGLQLTAADLAGRIILGDSPRQTRSWKGVIRGLAFYGQSLTGPQVRRHYESWKKVGRPELRTEDRTIAVYLFDEHNGRVAHSQIGSGSLYLPETYVVLDKVHLEPAWEEFEISWSYWSAVEKNIIGFIPFGFCFYAYWLVARPIRRPALVTIVMGAAVSFTIEFLQSYLPTRESGTTDLVTNTLGTALGVLLYRWSFARNAIDWVLRKANLSHPAAGKVTDC